MLKRLKNYIESRNLFRHSDKLLVAVSGGIDSVVLLDLLCKSSYKCGIAHCNFQLRGEESDGDEKFVISLGRKYGTETHVTRFDTVGYANKKGISTQMAARELRYEWFEKMADEYNYSYVVIAHNSDDNIETFHLNLARGTGLAGISGISDKAGKFVRPLLWAGRSEIIAYCSESSLAYREDSSNAKSDYKRNYLRHEIIPRFNKINPSYRETLIQNMEFFRQSAAILDHYYNDIVAGIVIPSGKTYNIILNKLAALPEPAWFLFTFLTPFGFNSTQIKDIANSIDSEPGKQFSSNSHQIIKDRDFLIMSELAEHVREELYLDLPAGKIEEPIKLEWKSFDAGNYSIPMDHEIASLDESKLKFPLKLRKWKPADSFHPFGMTQSKKISDFFIDNKLSLLDKQDTWLLISGEEIVWVVGHRIDNRYRINSSTRNVIQFRVLPGGQT